MGKILSLPLEPPREMAAILAAARLAGPSRDEAAWAAMIDMQEESGRHDRYAGGWRLWPECAPFGIGELIWGRHWLYCARPLGIVECRPGTLADWMAHGPLLCRWHPVRKVVVKDMEPFPVALSAGGADGRGWNTWDQKAERLSGGIRASAVPTAIWSLLDGPSPYFSRGDVWARYRNARDAEDALSDALVRWALEAETLSVEKE